MDREAVTLAVDSSRKRSSLRVLAHYVPDETVAQFVAPQADWLDVRYCTEGDDATFYRELAHADVIWHVLRPISGADLEHAPRCW